MMIRAIARFSVNDGEAAEFERLVAAAVAQTRTEDGVEEYSFYFSGNECVVHETYRDSTALATHVAGPVGTEIFPKALEITSFVVEFFGDLDDTAKGIASQFGAKVFPGPAHAL